MDLFFNLLGYAGSFIVLVSIMMSNVLKFRVINMLGATIFCIYGLLIGAYPVLAMNAVIVIVDIVYIFKLFNQKDFFDINEELKGHEFFLKRFFAFYGRDIRKFFPDFDIKNVSNPKILLVSRNINPVGLFIYQLDSESSSIIIHLDYACPKYRDTKNFFHILTSKAHDFKIQGFNRFVSRNRAPNHTGYLKKVGFIEQANGDFVLEF